MSIHMSILGGHMSVMPMPETRRRRNRTFQAVGCTALPALKAGWATRPLPPPAGASLLAVLGAWEVAVAVAAQALFGVQLLEQGLRVFAAEAEGAADGGDRGRAVAFGEANGQARELVVDGGGVDDVGLGADGGARGGEVAEGLLDLAAVGADVVRELDGAARARAVLLQLLEHLAGERSGLGGGWGRRGGRLLFGDGRLPSRPVPRRRGVADDAAAERVGRSDAADAAAVAGAGQRGPLEPQLGATVAEVDDPRGAVAGAEVDLHPRLGEDRLRAPAGVDVEPVGDTDAGSLRGDHVAPPDLVPFDAAEVDRDALVRLGHLQRPVVNLDRAHPRLAPPRQHAHLLPPPQLSRPKGAGDNSAVPRDRERAVDVQHRLTGGCLTLTVIYEG